MCARGIDVSDWQDPVNWYSVAQSGMAFAFTKATEGATFVADTFRSNWNAIQSVGLARGAYHFYRAKQDPGAQADLFLSTVPLGPDDLPPVLDIEATDGVSASRILDGIGYWLDVVERETKRRPIIYTYPSFWERIGNPKSFSDYPLWIAHYGTQNPWVPGGWDGWTLWQYTDTGTVSGISGGVDINWFNVSREGARGSHVRYVQQRLNERGFYRGSIDGHFSSALSQAVLSFQRAMNLTADGIVGINTWTALMSLRAASATPSPPPPPPSPPPVWSPPPPPPPPRTPTPTPIIQLLDVFRFYQGFEHQTRAIDWLQGQISQAVLLEFARLWRNQSTSQPSLIRLLDVCKYYRGLPYQDQAVRWLQAQLSEGVLQEFARRWRSQNPDREVAQSSPPISLINVCEYYQGFDGQKAALQWLQGQIQSSTLEEFARRWRS
ncbi:peptidoglycan-binding protein [Oxynema sp. CENA135]|uniref:GH25 family lysozyme n=1 Tax=Oxynema sp. CENA135 TaxID=984206 RepID=UPI00190CC23E|nr:GH25 family lysozyme [Oxynema sp. CENA135]MBK4731387.1 peptidoglycan-binding protein [Oxynema sp. CENA135]